jgi:hypothetical protein
MPAGDSEADGTAPVLGHERDVLEVEDLHEALEDTGVLGGRVAVAGWRGGQAESRVVRNHTAELVPQAVHEVAVEKGPGGVPV